MADTTNFKVVFGFGQDGKGWFEDYVSRKTDPAGLFTQLDNLITLRNRLLPPTVSWQGIRISDVTKYAQPGPVRATQFMRPSGAILDGTGKKIAIQRNGIFAAPTPGDREMPVNLCLQMRMTFGAGRQAFRYLTPIPDYVVGTDPGALQDFTGTPFETALGDFSAALTTGFWGLQYTRIDNTAASFTLNRVIGDLGTPPRMIIRVNLDSQPDLKINDFVAIQGTRPPKGTRLPTINGRWRVYDYQKNVSPGTADVTLDHSEGLVPSQVRIGPKSFMRLIIHDIIPMSSFQPHAVTTHRRGKVPFSPRGRRLSRATLDP